MLRLATVLILLASSAPVLAWGPQGHEIVAMVAAQELTPAARRQVTALLGGNGMIVHDANWADEIRDQRPATSPWHYVNIPLNAPGYVAARDCRRNACVVVQIADSRNVLANRSLPQARRAEALKFLIHFVGDVHQPLHAADNDDRGGNSIHVTLAGRRTNLHQVWDTALVQALPGDAAAIADDIERGLTPGQKKSWQSGNAALWANESLALARRDVYRMVDGRRSLQLSRNYIQSEAPVARMQLARAGVRLAWILNGALK